MAATPPCALGGTSHPSVLWVLGEFGVCWLQALPCLQGNAGCAHNKPGSGCQEGMGHSWDSGSTGVNGVGGPLTLFPHSPNEASQSCQPVLQTQLRYHRCASVSPSASQSSACTLGALFLGSDSPGLFWGLVVTWEGPRPSLPAGSCRAGGASAGMWGWEGRAW